MLGSLQWRLCNAHKRDYLFTMTGAQPRKRNKEKEAAYSKARYDSNKDRLLKQNKAYREANKERLAAQKKNRYEANKIRFSVENKMYREANREYEISRKKSWRLANPDRYRAYASRRRALTSGATATLTLEEWSSLWSEFEGLCFWCSDIATQMEHIVPLNPRSGELQGHHTRGNVVPTCQPCNNRKTNKDPLIFLFEMRKHEHKQSS